MKPSSLLVPLCLLLCHSGSLANIVTDSCAHVTEKAQLFVASQGSDISGTGSTTAPLRTLGLALKCVDSNGTVMMKARSAAASRVLIAMCHVGVFCALSRSQPGRGAPRNHPDSCG